MSRIIRSQQAKTDEQQKVEIQIRDMFTPISYTDQYLQQEQEPKLSIEQVMEERDRLLAEAMQTIELERQQFEAFREEQLQTLEQLKQLWEDEKPALQQQAYDEGFSQGYEEGMRKAEAQMLESIMQANNIVAQAEIDADKYLDSQESVILDLAMSSAGHIIGRLIEEDAEHFVDIVRRGLKEVREMDNIKIYVAPEHYAIVSKSRDELAEMFPPDVQFLVFVHEDLAETACYIETNHGRVVVSIDEQLQQLRQKLYEILESKE